MRGKEARGELSEAGTRRGRKDARRPPPEKVGDRR